jgi:mannose-6-phosphate isomerase-like protein (cupin superfamily)
MHIRAKQEIHNPLISPWGETVYELVGAAQASGSAASHSLAQIVIAPGCSSEKHYHKVSEETYYILAGTGRMVVDDREFVLIPGQACLIQPYEWHQILNDSETDLEFLAVCAPSWNAADSFND